MILQLVAEPARGGDMPAALVEDPADVLRERDMREQRLREQRFPRVDIGLRIASRRRRQENVGPLQLGEPQQLERFRHRASCRGALDGFIAEVIEDYIREHMIDPATSRDDPRTVAAEELVEIVHAYLS